MKIIAILLSLMCLTAYAAEEGPLVKEIHNGWDIHKIYVMTDTERGKWCYIVRNSDGTSMQCFDLKEDKE